MSASVLVVDDDSIIRSLVTSMRRSAGYDVLGDCASGDAALQQIGALKPALVLLDINLPDSDGIALIDMIRAVADPVIVMMSGEATMDRVRGAMTKGANGFVVKPFNAARLLAAVSAALKAS